jgi:hypothetical protein
LPTFNAPRKLIKLIHITLYHTKVKVKISGTLTDQFEVSTEVKQGDPLSALMFSSVMDVIMANLEMRAIISTRLADSCLC